MPKYLVTFEDGYEAEYDVSDLNQLYWEVGRSDIVTIEETESE